MRKKGQAAMEYLMTYGWAILIIIVVVGALFAMGVFKGGTTVGCSPCFGYFAYVDYADGTLLVRNGPREVNITVTNSTGGTLSTSPVCDAGTPCGPGTDITISGVSTITDEVITITYTDTGTIHN